MGRQRYPKKGNYKQKQEYVKKEPLANPEELQNEVVEGAQMLELSQENIKQTKIPYGYLISQQWLWDWQDYVGYSAYKSQKSPSTGKYFGKKKPGKINTELIRQCSQVVEYSNKIQEGVYLNKYLVSDFDKSDAKVVDEACWKYFYEKYGGEEICRPIFYINKKIKYATKLVKPDVLFLNKELISDIMNSKPNSKPDIKIQILQFARYWDLQQLQQFIFNYVLLEKIEENVAEIKIWLLDPSLPSNLIKLGFVSTIREKKFNVRGELLDYSKYKHDYIKNFIKSQYTLAIEIRTCDSPEWLFHQSSHPYGPGDKLKGTCEWCIETDYLDYFCNCKKVFYCCQSCKYKDQYYHSKYCDLAFDSEEEEEQKAEENGKPGSLSGHRGLKNIGNTCYMNSALQALACTKTFSEFYVSQVYASELKYQDKSLQRLTEKFAKVMRMLELKRDEPVSPWSLKIQFQILHNYFKGSAQHDSQEFISYLLDSLNDQLVPVLNSQDKLEAEELKSALKQEMDENNSEGSASHLLLMQKSTDVTEEISPHTYWKQCITKHTSSMLYNTFLGLFRSIITCPDCFSESISYETFITLSLPIMYKPTVQKLDVAIAFYDMSTELVWTSFDYVSENELKLIEIKAQILNQVDKNLKPNYFMCTIIKNNEIIRNYTLEDECNITGDKIYQETNSYTFFVIYEMKEPIENIMQDDHFVQIAFTTKTLVANNTEMKNSFTLPRFAFINKYAPISQFYYVIIDKIRTVDPNSFAFVESLSTSFLDQIQQVIDQRNIAGPSDSQSNSQTSASKSQQPLKQQIIVPNQWDMEIPIMKSEKKEQGPKPSESSSQEQPAGSQKAADQNPADDKASQPKEQAQAEGAKSDQPSQPTASTQPKEAEEKKSDQPSQSTASTQPKKAEEKKSDQPSQPSTSSQLEKPSSEKDKAQQPTAPQDLNQQKTQQVSNQWDFDIVSVPPKNKSTIKKVNSQPTGKPNPTAAQKSSSESQDATAKKQPGTDIPVKSSSEKSAASDSKKAKPEAAQQPNSQPVHATSKQGEPKGSAQQQQPGAKSSAPQEVASTKKESNSNASTGAKAEKEQAGTSVSEEKKSETVSDQQKPPQKECGGEEAKAEGKAGDGAQDQQKPSSGSSGEQKSSQQQKAEEEDILKDVLTQLPFKINVISNKIKKNRKKICNFCKKACSNCQLPFQTDKTFEEFLDGYKETFSLEVYWEDSTKSPKSMKQQLAANSANNGGNAQQIKSSNLCSIYDCLRLFQEPEQLSHDNGWYCKKCDDKKQAYKAIQIQFAPRYLILHIKRFRHNMKGEKEKNCQQIAYEEELDITEVIQEKNPNVQLQSNKYIYQLYSVILHEGSLEKGHYYSFCKYQNQWYEMNDDKVSEVQLQQVLCNKSAYILFYQLKTQ